MTYVLYVVIDFLQLCYMFSYNVTPISILIHDLINDSVKHLLSLSFSTSDEYVMGFFFHFSTSLDVNVYAIKILKKKHYPYLKKSTLHYMESFNGFWRLMDHEYLTLYLTYMHGYRCIFGIYLKPSNFSIVLKIVFLWLCDSLFKVTDHWSYRTLTK